MLAFFFFFFFQKTVEQMMENTKQQCKAIMGDEVGKLQI